MRLKRIVLLFATLLFASLCWGQYSTSSQQGVADITSSCTAKVNCWYLLPTGGVCQANTLATDADGDLWCRGMDNYLYSWNGSYWVQQTAMGTSAAYVALANRTAIWSLQTTAYCTAAKAGTFGIFQWTGSAWYQPSPTNACLFQLSITKHGTLVGQGGDYYPYESTNSGVSWQRLGNVGVAAVSASDDSVMCGIGTGGVYLLVNGVFALMSSQPAGEAVEGMAGCVMPSSQHGAAVMFAWTKPGLRGIQPIVSVYDFSAQAWSALGTPKSGIYSVASYDKGSTIGLDSSGHPYHYNVYGAYVGGATVGSFNFCPSTGCPPGATHEITLRVRYPNTLKYADGYIKTSPSTNVNVAAYAIANPNTDDTNPCDLFFGDPSDPGCQPSFTSDSLAHCDVSGQNFAGGGSGTMIHVPGVSYDLESYSGTNISVYELPFPPFSIAGINCGLVNTCLPPTQALCRPQSAGGTLAITGIEEIAIASDPATALGYAQEGCNMHYSAYHDPYSKTIIPGAWRIFSIYDPSIGAASCNYIAEPSYSYPYLSCR